MPVGRKPKMYLWDMCVCIQEGCLGGGRGERRAPPPGRGGDPPTPAPRRLLACLSSCGTCAPSSLSSLCASKSIRCASR